MKRNFLIFLFLLVLGAAGCGSPLTGPNMGSWTRVTANAPWAGRHFLSGTVFNNEMWLSGGLSTDASASVTQFYKDIWHSGDGANWQLSNGNPPFGPRYGHRLLSMGGTLYLIGGKGSGIMHNDVWSSTDGITWINIFADATASPTHFSRRMDFGAQVFNNRLWIIGGWDGTSQNDVWNSADGITWTQVLATGPKSATHYEGRWGHATVIHNNLLWVIGGASGSPAPAFTSFGYSDVWNTPDGVTWTKIFDGKLDGPNNYRNNFGDLYYLQTVENNGLIWLTCGWNWPMDGATRTVGTTADGANWAFNPNAPFSQRFYHLSLSFQGSVWIMGGMNNIGTRTFFNDVWRSP